MRSKGLIFSALLILICSNVFGQTGGNFTITESVVAGGGQQSNGGAFSLDGTVGQAVAGNPLGASSFAVTSGFWNFNALAPTAAGASLGGRVSTDGGKGILNVLLTLTGAAGETFYARSGISGKYQFENVPTGQGYILTVGAKRFTFASNTQIISLVEDLANVNFIGTAQF